MGSRQQIMSGFRQYEVVGRHVPTERDPNPKAYRIKLFSKNEANAKSRFWYFIRRVVKMKKAHGEILQIREIFEKHPSKVSIHVIKAMEIAAADCIRTNTKQFHSSDVKFPLPHRVPRANKKGHRKGTKATRPVTCV